MAASRSVRTSSRCRRRIVAHVLEKRHRAGLAPPLHEDAPGEAHRDAAAVGGRQVGLHPGALAAGAGRLHGAAEKIGQLRRQQIDQPAPVQHVLLRVAEDPLGLGVEHHDRQRFVGGDDPVVRAADQVGEEVRPAPQLGRGRGDPALQVQGVLGQAAPDLDLLLGPPQGDRQRFGAERLGDEVRGPEVQRLDRQVDVPVSGDDDHLGPRRTLLDALEDLDPVHAGHLDVRDHDRGRRGVEGGQTLRAGAGRSPPRGRPPRACARGPAGGPVRRR